MSITGLIDCQVEQGVARLHLNRPDRGNALDGDLAAALRAAATSLGDAPDVRVIRLSGEGRMFCVGGDLGYVAQHDVGPGEALQALAGDLHAAIRALIDHPAPVVARIHGPAGGAGMSLVCACDVAIAGESAAFTSAYTRAGLSPDGGLTWLLPHIVGPVRAKDIMLTNRRIDAREALALGIVSRVVGDEDLDDAVDKVVEALANGAPGAAGAVKRLVAASATAELTTHLDAEAASIAGLSETPDGREGVSAFLEKRSPAFGGVS